MKKLLVIILCMPMMAIAATSFVYDTAGVLTSTEIESLNNTLYAFEQSSSNEIAVVVVPSLEGDYIEHYAVKKFEELKPGKEKVDNGALLVVAIQDRKMRIEVGYGLEPYITDSQAQIIIDDIIAPEFKKGDYFSGISKGVEAMMGLTTGAYTLPQKTKSIPINGELIMFVVFILYAIFASTKSWWLGGVVGGIVGTILAFFVGSILYSGIIIISAILIGLLFDYIASKSGKRGFYFFGGGGHGGSGGFGGFGGGSSGGGGASGSW